MPFSTSSAAASAATCFSRSMLMSACLQAVIVAGYHRTVSNRPTFGFGVRFEQRPQVVQPVEQVPYVGRGALFPVRVQVGQLGILAVAVEGRLGLPFDEDHHL